MDNNSKKIVIDNFGDMRPDLPTFSAKNTMYMASGVNPLYYLDNNSKQEEVISPLAASLQMTRTSVNTTGTITDVISVLDSVPYAIADTSGYVTNGSASPAAPFGTTTSQVVSLANFGPYLFAASSASTNIAYAGVASSSFGLVASNAGSSLPNLPYFMTPFLQYLLVMNQNKVFTMTIGALPIPPSSTPAMTLSSGFIILGPGEVWGNYVSIPAARSYIQFTDNYLYLWNGYGVTYQYNIPLPGKYIGQVNIGGILYVVIEERKGVCTLGYIKGYQFQPDRILHGISVTMNRGGTVPLKGRAVTNVRGFVCVSTDTGMYLYRVSPGVGNISYLHDTNNYYQVIASSPSPNGNDLFDIYGIIGNSVYTTAGSTTYNPVSYDSQYAEVTPSRIKIWYDQPPQSSTDAIYTTLYGIDEYDSTGALANEIVPLVPITSVNHDNAKNTVLDCGGFTGDKMSIYMTTTGGNSSWRPIIKRIEIFPQ